MVQSYHDDEDSPASEEDSGSMIVAEVSDVSVASVGYGLGIAFTEALASFGFVLFFLAGG